MKKIRFCTTFLCIMYFLCSFAQQSGNYVILRLNPTNASVWIDSIRQQNSNGIVQCYLPLGTHTYKVSAQNFQTSEGHFDIISSSRTDMDIKLKSLLGYIKIISNDDDVYLSINEEKLSKKTWSGYYSPGRHTIKATKSGYQPYVEIIDVLQGGEYKIIVPELKKTKGGINFNIQPLDAEIYIDDKFVGKSPMVINDIDIGRYKIKATKSGYAPLEKTIKVKEGVLTTIQDNLVAYEGVDLGLSVLWATFNVGAVKPTSNGSKYDWGADIGTNFFGTELIYGSTTRRNWANLAWGGKWRTPTSEEIIELITKCKWEYTFVDNIHVVRIVGPNGNSIILPIGSYWASDRCKGWRDDRIEALCLDIYERDGYLRCTCGDYYGDLYYNNLSKYYANRWLNIESEISGRNVKNLLMIRPVMSK